MNPEIIPFIKQAKDISTSGRWKALNEKIREILENPAIASEWSLRVHAPLTEAVFLEYLELKDVYDKGRYRDLSLLAWRARNLLELSIWCKFCGQKDENAKRFYEDLGRDSRDVLDNFKVWGEKNQQSQEWSKSFVDAKDKLSESAQAKGVVSVDGDYKSIRDVAEECGPLVLSNYRAINKYLSKYAHPTALSILGGISEDNKNDLRDAIWGQGCVLFVEAFSDLEEYFARKV